MADRLFAAEAGQGPETVVFLHGYGGWHGVWRYVLEALSPKYTTIAFDLPGHGGSLPVSGGGSARAMVAAVSADLAARGLSRVHIAGHSMGGAVAALLAIAEPDRFASVSLFAPGGFGEQIAGPLLKRYGEAVTSKELRSYVGAMRGPTAEDDDPQLDRLAEIRSIPGQRDALIEIHGRIVRDGKQGMIPRDQLAGLTMPVTVAWGTGDGVLPAVQSLHLPPQFRVLRVPAAGHMLPETHPLWCARVIEHSVQAAAKEPSTAI